MSCVEVNPSSKEGFVRLNGKDEAIPDNWTFVKPGDSALTRRLKNGESYQVKVKGKKKYANVGVWAPSSRVATIKRDLEIERSQPEYQKKIDSGRKYRAAKEEEYVDDFENAILDVLNFHANHADIAKDVAKRVAKHATPVGSGTVARTKRIPIKERANAAIWAWLRHAITPYDTMKIKNGERREVRKKMKKRNTAVISRYRARATIPDDCPLRAFLAGKKIPKGNTNMVQQNNNHKKHAGKKRARRKAKNKERAPKSIDHARERKMEFEEEDSSKVVDLVSSDGESDRNSSPRAFERTKMMDTKKNPFYSSDEDEPPPKRRRLQ